MQLYEWEAKDLLEAHGVDVPRRVFVRSLDEVESAYQELGCSQIVVKAQVMSGKRGKHGGILMADSLDSVRVAAARLIGSEILGKPVIGVILEERLDIATEHYVAMTYDSVACKPICLSSESGGVDVEDVADELMNQVELDVRDEEIKLDITFAQELWAAFKKSDARLIEVNPLVQTKDGKWYAADAKIILDDDASFRHEEWSQYEDRSDLGRPLTDREIDVKRIDKGKDYYRGTAGKYIELEGDIAVLFSGGGASIANMDALIAAGHSPANYTEYSGNPPREKVYRLAKIVLSKPGLKGLWIAGGVANFTNVDETFHGIVDALSEVKPEYPIVVRRAGPHDKEGMERMQSCALLNGLNMKLFGKDVSMTETASILAEMIKNQKETLSV